MAGKRPTAGIMPTRLNGIMVQSSVAGNAIPRGWGTFRAPANLLWYGAFTATPVNTSTGGGKGGAQKTSTTSYNYSASIVAGICSGPIDGVRTVYADQNVYTPGSETGLQQAGLSLAVGDLGQAPWSYLTTNFPDQAIGYSGIAYAYAADLALGESAALPNFGFEVQSSFRTAGDDCNPADILADFIPSIPFWPTGAIASLSDYGDYCTAAGLVLSPVLDTQRQASDFLTEIMQATNSAMFWSGGQLKVVPYGDTAIGSWTPDLTPVYDLTDDDFEPASEGDDPVQQDISRAADAWNYVQVEFLDRSNNYNSQISVGFDAANIAQYGRNPNTSPYSLHSICDATVAAHAAQLVVQRACNIRRTFKFNLGGNFDLLEPMDLVTLTSDNLDRVLVRITKCQEKQGLIAFEAEEMLVGTAHAAGRPSSSTDGYIPDYAIDPGGVNEYALINPPRTLTGGDYELWLGAVGASAAWGGAEVWLSLDGGATFGYSGQDIIAPARLGVLTTTLPIHADPDTVHTLGVDLTGSGGVLISGSMADADNAVTLCLVGDELISYETATLTSAFHYDLTYLRRGLYATTIAAASIGDSFIRLDSAIARVSYLAQQDGSTVQVKFRSFNIYGQGLQDLSVCTAYSVVLDPGAAPIVDIISTDTTHVGGVASSLILTELATAITDITALTTTSAALVAEILLLGAPNGGNTAFVLDQTTTQISPGVTLASYITGVASTMSSNTAAIATESSTRATADTALASSITTVSTTVAGHTSSITSLFSSVSGLNSQWVLSLDSNGHIAGIVLANGSTSSSLTIVATDFIFTDGVTTTPPFYISGGVVYADYLVVQNLRVDTIVTDHIQADQVSTTTYITDGASVSIGASAATISSTSVTCADADEDVEIAYSTDLNNPSSSQEITVQLNILVDGTQIKTTNNRMFKQGSGNQTFSHPAFSLTPGAGSHSIELQAWSNLGVTPTKTYNEFIITRLRR